MGRGVSVSRAHTDTAIRSNGVHLPPFCHLKKGLQVRDAEVRQWLWLRGPREAGRSTGPGAGCLEAEGGGLVLGRSREANWVGTALLGIEVQQIGSVSFVTQRRHSGTVQWYRAVHKCKTAFSEYGESKNES